MAGYPALSLGAAGSCTYSGILTPVNSTYYLGGGGGVLTFSHAISSGSVVIGGGPGSVILANPNSYTGGTTVNTGTLVAANASGSATGNGNVTMNGGTLASATSGGSISGNVIGGSGPHIIAPGGVGTIGTLSIGGLVTASNLTELAFDLTTPGGSGDLLMIGSGGLTLAPHTAIVFGTDPTATGDYRLIGGTFGTPALSDFDLPTAPPGESYLLSTTVDSGYIDLVVQPVPEPSTLALLCAGAMGIVVLAWRRRVE